MATSQNELKKQGTYSVNERDLSITWGDDHDEQVKNFASLGSQTVQDQPFFRSRSMDGVFLGGVQDQPFFRSPGMDGVFHGEVEKVYKVEVRGKTKMSDLKPWVKYEVLFVIKQKNVAVTFTLELPDAPKQERKVNLSELPRNEWIKVKIGEFQTKDVQGNTNEVKYSLTAVCHHKPSWWKKSLEIKAVDFVPFY